MITDQEKLEQFIKSHNVAVMATVSQDFLPEAAAMGYAIGENLQIYFGTLNTSRKWVNLQKNSKVALVIGWEKGKTVQYEGEAKELPKSQHSEVLKKYFANNPTLIKYLSAGEAAMFVVTPTWIRYSDNSVSPANEIELKL